MNSKISCQQFYFMLAHTQWLIFTPIHRNLSAKNFRPKPVDMTPNQAASKAITLVYTLVFTRWFLQGSYAAWCHSLFFKECAADCISFALNFNGLIRKWWVMHGHCSSQWLGRIVSWTWKVLFDTGWGINQQLSEALHELELYTEYI